MVYSAIVKRKEFLLTSWQKKSKLVNRQHGYFIVSFSRQCLEVRDNNKAGWVYCQQINNYQKKTLYPIIEAKVISDAQVVTDEFPSYDKLKAKFPKARQRKSDKGKTFSVFISKS